MTNSTIIPPVSTRQAAIVTGISMLIMTVAAMVATELTIGRLTVEGNAAQTTQNITASPDLFRMGVLSWLIIVICDLLIAWGLYIYLKRVSESLSLLTAWFRLIYVAILVGGLTHYAHLLSLAGMDPAALPSNPDLQLLVMADLASFDQFWSLGLVVFGLHILLLGYLALKSGFIPKFLSVWLLIGGLGYLIVHAAMLIFPVYESTIRIMEYVFILPMLGEVAFGIWLLFRGNR